MTDIIEIAWLGGLLEGEAWFGLLGGKKGYKYPIVRVAMTDEDPIVRAATVLGTGVYHRKTMYITEVHGANAVKWMLILLPFLGKRRRGVIAGIIKFWKEHSAHVAPNGARTMATCHPDRVVVAFDMCQACYDIWRRPRKLLKKAG